MLQAAVRPAVAKLDISQLLDSGASPRTQVVSIDTSKDSYGARSASDPPPARMFVPESHRSSISSTHSSIDAYALASASTLPPQSQSFRGDESPFDSALQRREGYQHQQRQGRAVRQHHRPRIPSLSALPISSSSVEQSQRSRHSARSLSGPLFPDPVATSTTQQKRPAPRESSAAPPAKRQSKWTAEEDSLVIELRGAGMKWEDISKRIPGRTPLSCRLHYQNYIERRSQWDEDRKNRLARLYERLKAEMWKPLAAELNVPWRAAEAMHWQLGQVEMARRAGVTPFAMMSGSGGTPTTSRIESSLIDISPTAANTPASPYTSSLPSLYPQSARQRYVDDREQSYEPPPQSRTRSISIGSGDEGRHPGALGHPPPWGSSSAASLHGRNADNWSLPRLAEMDANERPQQRAGNQDSSSIDKNRTS